jgi:hypothetical protein
VKEQCTLDREFFAAGFDVSLDSELLGLLVVDSPELDDMTFEKIYAT